MKKTLINLIILGAISMLCVSCESEITKAERRGYIRGLVDGEENANKAYYDRGFRSGKDEGLEQGREEGHQEGYKQAVIDWIDSRKLLLIAVTILATIGCIVFAIICVWIPSPLKSCFRDALIRARQAGELAALRCHVVFKRRANLQKAEIDKNHHVLTILDQLENIPAIKDMASNFEARTEEARPSQGESAECSDSAAFRARAIEHRLSRLIKWEKQRY